MSPVIFEISGFEVRWYSCLILLAVFVVYSLTLRESQKFGMSKNYIFNLLFWGLIFGIIGARLYYVIFNWSMFSDDWLEIFKVWNGGLAIHGGLIAGLITIIIYTKKYNVRTMRVLDFIVVPLLLGQAIGRWGNFFNQEAHGAATTLATLQSLHIPDFIIEGMTIDGVVYTPTFLYESIVCAIAFFVLAIVRRGKYTKVGMMTACYLIIYGTLRFFIEMSRTDALMLGGFKVAQIVSVVMFLIGLGMIMFFTRMGKFEDLYNEKSNINEVRF